jgi:LysR family hydrogen peroxide-inducible transcriptional activator
MRADACLSCTFRSMTTPTFRQLEYVVALAECQHFGRAAASLGVSQPALSRQIQEVEDALGVALFERSRSGIIATFAGELVVERARRLLLEHQDMVDEVCACGGTIRGMLRIGAIPTVAPYFLPGLISRIRERFPELTIHVAELRTDELTHAIQRGELDVGLLAVPLEVAGLLFEPFVDEPFALVCESTHPLAQTDELRADALRELQLLLMEEGHCFRDQALEVCSRSGAVQRTDIEAASISTLVRLVEAGLGPTLLPLSALKTELSGQSDVVARLFAGEQPTRRLALAWRASSSRHGLMRRITDLCREHVTYLQAALPEDSSGQRGHLSIVVGER